MDLRNGIQCIHVFRGAKIADDCDKHSLAILSLQSWPYQTPLNGIEWWPIGHGVFTKEYDTTTSTFTIF